MQWYGVRPGISATRPGQARNFDLGRVVGPTIRPIGTPDPVRPPAAWGAGGNSFHGQVAAALRLLEGERSVAAVAGTGASERHRHPTRQRLGLGSRLRLSDRLPLNLQTVLLLMERAL